MRLIVQVDREDGIKNDENQTKCNDPEVEAILVFHDDNQSGPNRYDDTKKCIITDRQAGCR